MTKKIQQYQAAAKELEHVLNKSGFRPILIGSVARSYQEELTHTPKDIDFVILRDSPLQTIKLYRAMWKYRNTASIYQKPFLVFRNHLPEPHPVFEVGETVGNKVEVWVNIFQPIFKGIPIDIMNEMPMAE